MGAGFDLNRLEYDSSLRRGPTSSHSSLLDSWQGMTYAGNALCSGYSGYEAKIKE